MIATSASISYGLETCAAKYSSGRAFLVALEGKGGNGDSRDLAKALDASDGGQELVAVHLGHCDVEDKNVRGPRVQEV